MNKSGQENRSVRNTKRKLREGLLELMEEKAINEISVKELTDLVDVNRGTFYFHYADIFDMLGKIEDEFFEQFNQTLNNTVLFDNSAGSRLDQYLNAIFSFLWDNRSFCRIMLGPNGDMRFVERIKKLVDDKCSYIWQEFSPHADERKYEMYNAFIINGCIGIIQRWLNGQGEETPDRITSLAATIILNSVESCIA